MLWTVQVAGSGTWRFAGALTATVIQVHELDSVGQFTRDSRRVMRTLGHAKLKEGHGFDDARREIEISRDTPYASYRPIRLEMRVTGMSSVLISRNVGPVAGEVRRHDDCHDDTRNDMMAVKRHVRCHGATTYSMRAAGAGQVCR